MKSYKELADRVLEEPIGYTQINPKYMQGLLVELEQRGIRTFEVNGQNYSIESLEQLVGKIEIELHDKTETKIAIGADISEPWIREKIDRLVPYVGHKGFSLITS